MIKNGNIKVYEKVSEDLLENIYNKSIIGLLPFFKFTPRWGGQLTKALDFLNHEMIVITGPEGIRGIEVDKNYHVIYVRNASEFFNELKKSFKTV